LIFSHFNGLYTFEEKDLDVLAAATLSSLSCSSRITDRFLESTTNFALGTDGYRC